MYVFKLKFTTSKHGFSVVAVDRFVDGWAFWCIFSNWWVVESDLVIKLEKHAWCVKVAEVDFLRQWGPIKVVVWLKIAAFVAWSCWFLAEELIVGLETLSLGRGFLILQTRSFVVIKNQLTANSVNKKVGDVVLKGTKWLLSFSKRRNATKRPKLKGNSTFELKMFPNWIEIPRKGKRRFRNANVVLSWKRLLWPILRIVFKRNWWLITKTGSRNTLLRKILHAISSSTWN